MKTVSPRADMPFIAEFNASGISWAAVIGGAFVAAAFALILFFLGIGIGLYSISPWVGAGATSKTVGTGTIIWMIVTEIIAMSLGGYLAGRLRTKWSTVHTDEVYFRDTAHGVLVWAVAVVSTMVIIAFAVSIMLGNGVGAYTAVPGTSYKSAPGGIMSTTPGGSTMTMPGGAASTTPGGTTTTPGGEETTPGEPGSKTTPYTPGSQTEPGTPRSPGMHVTPAPGPQITLTPEDIDRARRAAAKGAIWMFISMLIGAFCAAIAALIGGRQRDAVVYYEYDYGTGPGTVTETETEVRSV